jgi:hypothetical protein
VTVSLRTKPWIVVSMTALVLGVASCAEGFSNAPRDGESASTTSDQIPDAEYPGDWKTSLDEARVALPFELIVPDTADASTAKLVSVFLWPNSSAVAMTFPPPAPADAFITQPYIEVYESKWNGGDPLEDYRHDIAADPVKGKSISEIEGLPALVVEPHSPDADDQANPAFIRFVVGDTEVHVSGGEDLDRLKDIASSIILSWRG